VVLALPAEQAAALLRDPDPGMAARAAASSTAPCWTVMAAFESRLDLEVDTLRDEGRLGWAARNSSKPGRQGPEAWVLQADPDWSREHLEAPAETVIEALLGDLARRMGAPLPDRVLVQAHRWRYARSSVGEDLALWSADRRLGCCGDWLSGPRIECAWDSGEALARLLTGVSGA
jgi:predicted NAD/FAD-dependent oxidoreductase